MSFKSFIIFFFAAFIGVGLNSIPMTIFFSFLTGCSMICLSLNDLKNKN